MTDNTTVEMCPICQDAPTAAELARNSKFIDDNVVRCMQCRNVIHYSCLERHFKHLDDGNETCPLCRQEIPILHPGSCLIKQQKFTNQLLGKLINGRSQETTVRLTAVAALYESSPAPIREPCDDIKRISDELMAAVQAEAESVMLSSFHPPLRTALECSDSMWENAVGMIKLDTTTLSGRNPLKKLEMQVYTEFCQILFGLRKDRLQTLHDENKEECLRLLADVVRQTAREDAAKFTAIPREFQFSHQKRGRIQHVYMVFFKNTWTARIVTSLRATCAVIMEDVKTFQIMYKQNYLSDDEQREIFKEYDEAASDVLGLRYDQPLPSESDDEDSDYNEDHDDVEYPPESDDEEVMAMIDEMQRQIAHRDEGDEGEDDEGDEGEDDEGDEGEDDEGDEGEDDEGEDDEADEGDE